MSSHGHCGTFGIPEDRRRSEAFLGLAWTPGYHSSMPLLESKAEPRRSHSHLLPYTLDLIYAVLFSLLS